MERLFFALFGLTKAEDLRMTSKNDLWVLTWIKILFALYLLLTAIVLINLLIAMMSDTYQRIQVYIGIYIYMYILIGAFSFIHNIKI